MIGYETLSRGPAPFESPSLLFACARQLGMLAELDHACLAAALARIRASRGSNCDWFLNVTPEVFCQFDAADAASSVRAYGLDPVRIVFEITERDALVDVDTLQLRGEPGAELPLPESVDEKLGAGKRLETPPPVSFGQ